MRVSQISNYNYGQKSNKIRFMEKVQSPVFKGCKGTLIGTAAGSGLSAVGAALWVAAVGTVPLLVLPAMAGAVIMGAGAGKIYDEAVKEDEKNNKGK